MTTTLFAAALLAASLAADPAPAAAPSAKPATATPVAAPAAKAATPAQAPKPPAPPPASPEALKDARTALLGPCTPQMASAKVTAVEVLDATQLNARLEAEKSSRLKAEPGQRFLAVTYAAGAATGQSVRQVTTHHQLTTEQAQKLVGEKLCVFTD